MRHLLMAWTLFFTPLCFATDVILAEQSTASERLNASQLFSARGPLIFQDNFSRNLMQWKLSIDDDKHPDISNPRVVLVRHDGDAAPAVRMTLPGTAGNFRSEIFLPAEKNYQERWYAERTLVPKASDDKGFILMQWHALIGEEKKLHQNETGIRNFPNLAIHFKNDRYEVTRAWGPLLGSRRDHQALGQAMQVGEWVDWVVHAIWSEQDDGLVQIWLNQQLVYEVRGPNLYNDVERVTPYFKTGIYRPTRRPSNGDTSNESYTVVYVSRVSIGNALADLQMMQHSLPH